MLALRYLNGPNMGQFYLLKEGNHKLGRAESCQIQIHSQGVSKEHLEIQVSGGHLVILDTHSSNGTFLNGIKIQKAVLKVGDRLSVDKFLFDIVRIGEAKSLSTQVRSEPIIQISQGHEPIRLGQKGISEKLDLYIESALLPGIYHLSEVFSFKSVIFGFSALFIFLVTFLSLLPMNQITEESIRIESTRRAQTVSRALANSNEKAVRNGELSSYSSDLVLKDDGITNVYILAKDGSIIAPPEMAGMTAKDLVGFVSSIKGQNKEVTGQLQGGKIAASTPILVYDSELQQNIAKAHAVVVYDPGHLKYDDGRAFSLFLQMLTIAIFLGSAIFFLMYKLIEYPFKQLNREIDGALREGLDHISTKIKFPILQQLLVTVNSLLSRVSHSQMGGLSSTISFLEAEWINLTQLMGYPSVLLTKDQKVVSINPYFEQLTGIQFQNLLGQSVDYIPDQALKKNLEGLVIAAQSNTQVVHQDRIEFAGQFFAINCQAISASGEIQYYLITLSPQEEMGNAHSGGAA